MFEAKGLNPVAFRLFTVCRFGNSKIVVAHLGIHAEEAAAAAALEKPRHFDASPSFSAGALKNVGEFQSVKQWFKGNGNFRTQSVFKLNIAQFPAIGVVLDWQANST